MCILQSGVLGVADISAGYNSLVSATEEFLRELNSRQEQQRIKEEEAERVRKIKEEQVML